MKTLTDTVCIVTGASRGIGKAIAGRLAAEGARVVAVARDKTRLDRLEASSDSIRALVCDVTEEDRVEATVRDVLECEGRIDVLVNNAGTAEFCLLEETTYESFQHVMNVNVGGPFLFSKAVLPGMKKRRQGEIINISSIVGVQGYPGQAVYSASKHAVNGLTKALAAEVQADGIRVRSVSTGAVDTELGKAAKLDVDPSELMQPEDIASLVVFLLTGPPSGVVDNINIRRPGSKPWF